MTSKGERDGVCSGTKGAFVGAWFFGFFNGGEPFEGNFEDFLNFDGRRKNRLLDSSGGSYPFEDWSRLAFYTFRVHFRGGDRFPFCRAAN